MKRLSAWMVRPARWWGCWAKAGAGWLNRRQGLRYLALGWDAAPWTMRSLSTLKAPGAELA